MRAVLPEKLENGRIREGDYASDASDGPVGAFRLIGPNGGELAIISSGVDREHRWEHVSVSLKNRAPNWPEMCFVKDLFWHDDECVVQFHPPKSSYINFHPHCLHLWRPLDGLIPMPPTILVGPQR
jgi:hypothetical protein